MRDIREQLKQLKYGHERIRPDLDWVSKSRQVLLQQIRNTVFVPSSKNTRLSSRHILQAVTLFFSRRTFLILRTASLIFLAMLVTTGGWIASVNAAFNSLPGDALYNVKLATEKTELIVTSVVGTEKEKVTTLLRHASNRVEEYQKSKTPDQAKVVIQSLKKSIESTNKHLEQQVGAGASTNATELAKVVNEKTEELLDSLNTKTVLPPTEFISDQEVSLQKEVGEATHLIEVAGVIAVQVLAEQTLAGDQSVDVQEVKATVEKKLDHIVTDVSALQQDVVGAPSTTEAVPSIVLSGVTVSTTVSTTIEIATEQAIETGKFVEKTVAEARTMIQNNDLLGAIKKVEELTEVKKGVGVAAIEAKIMTNSLTLPDSGSNVGTMATDTVDVGIINTNTATETVR